MSLAEYDFFIGRRLERNIYGNNGILLISKDTVLLQSHIDKLANFKIRIGSIEAAVADSPEGYPEAEAMDLRAVLRPSSIESRKKVKRAEMHLHEIDRLVRSNDIVPIDDVEEKILPFIKETAKKYNLFQVFADLKEQGDFRYKQSIGVAVIATALGRRLNLDDEEMGLLATAACVYDIGSVKLPSSLMDKQGRFDKHEYEIMKQHTVLGYDLLMNSGVDPRVALVALQHHEREDGSGYPYGIKGDQMDRLSKIVTLADIYMAMISDRPHRPALSFFEVINEIHQGIIHNRFDSYIGMTFLDSLLASQVGCEVHLSDGRTGRILLTNVNYPTRPLIAVDQKEFIDLSKISDLHIVDVMG
ncbi:HD-GYP domain-containing protein [Paenibacillus sp. PK3_47]|uniref:HD-GYP domain-containing protein n=1 Tax=Paenibacillus sp. PK3_47 TaxID=2072642 RepID=UPI00201D73D7|nr:HD domain-containing phosphohydrolase [Paenibacillus sp. PK3_47]UQZ35540.1 HD-GYP domain-containing protein [Paenibacillus sp. PK3_47]